MQAACEAGDVFAWLEGGAGGARDAADALAALYHSVREPWLVRALLLYHARTGSERALGLLARAPEHHARLALDALAEQLRAPDSAPRHHALAALAPLVARRPPWLHLLLPPSPLARELLRAARREREPAPLLNALLALAALLPSAPALAAAHPAELAEALTRAALADGSLGARAHLALGARAVFRAAYATHPCTVVEALRAHGAELGGAARAQWERGVALLTRGVALHPALVCGARRGEAEGARWSREDPLEVVAQCARLAMDAGEPRASPSPPPASPLPAGAALRGSPTPRAGSGAHAALAAGALLPGGEGWWSLGERTGADAAPHTPLPPDAPEPEPAVEATPENTPARLARQAFRFPAPDSPAARAIGRTPPPPGGALDACAARLARVAAERRAQDSPVPMGGAPPAAAARPEPRAPRPLPLPADDPEDREVGELTARDAAWGGGGRAARTQARGAGDMRRAHSWGPPPTAARRSMCAQTVDTWPAPYDCLVDFAADLTTEPLDADPPPDKQALSATEGGVPRLAGGAGVDPAERLDRYLVELYSGKGGAGAEAGGAAELAEQLALAHAQLLYERWRRDAHAERNRRLLGRCRTVRALELANGALQDRVRALTRERDALRGAVGVAGGAAPAGGGGEREAALERELAAERAARGRAEAALCEARAGGARDAAELQRTRGESFETARHVEALARAALAAERRAEHVRRLRRELLLLAEREARLHGAVRGALSAARGSGAAPDAAVERALRAACARAEADAEASSLRADALAARAHELEAGVATREVALQELKRAARAQAEEGAARTRAMRDKYAALLRVVRAHGARDLELRAHAPSPPALTPAP